MQSILTLIRWKNLLIIALVQILIKYALFASFNISITLSTIGFSLLVLATLFLAAAGYIINDIYDVETDTVNKPNKVLIGKKVSEKTANTLFIVFNVIGVCIGMYLSNSIGKSSFFPLFIIVSALLYIYASYLKQMTLIGNIVVSALVAFSLIIVGIFDLLPVITAQNQSIQTTMFKILLDYALFAFAINLIREIVKDAEDIDGDYKQNMKTLPIVLGINRTAKIAFGLTVVTLIGIIMYVGNYLYIHTIAIVYFLIAIITPLIYCAIKLFQAETKKQFHHISLILKLVMILGMLSMLLYLFIL
ncbi:geranylgeranylglycerol-phosphate geranylgeranyltransferase [Lacinutrix salivirga]